MQKTFPRIITAAAIGAAVLGGGAWSLASTGSPAVRATATTATPSGCIYLRANRTLERVYAHSAPACPSNTIPLSLSGARGPAGPQGPAGPPASDVNGSLFNAWTAPTPNTMLAHIGGPIRANGTELGTISLKPGTYLINANAMFERTVADSDPSITSDTYPEITLWDGTTWAPDFSNTVGAWLGGPMSHNIFINTTASGSAVLRVKSATTLHIVAFAYDEDRGSEGSVEVNTASVSVVQVGK